MNPSRSEAPTARLRRRKALLIGAAIGILALGAFWAWLGPVPAETRPRAALSVGGALALVLALAIRELRAPVDHGMEALSRELGLSFSEDDPPGFGHAIDGFRIRSELVRKRKGYRGTYTADPVAGPVLSGKLEDLEIYVAAFGWRGSAHKHRKTVVLARKTEWHLPHLLVRPEGVGDRILAGLGGQDVDFPEDPTFSSSFVVRGAGEEAIRQVLDPEVRSRLKRLPDLSLEARGSTVVLYWDRPPLADEIRSRLPALLGLVRSLVSG